MRVRDLVRPARTQPRITISCSNNTWSALGQLLLDAAGLLLHQRLRLLHVLKEVATTKQAASAVFAVAAAAAKERLALQCAAPRRHPAP